MNLFHNKMKKAILFSIFISLFFIGSVLAQEARIWTGEEIYSDGDYIEIHIELPEQEFSSCETHLVDPQGNEVTIGEGGCVAGIIEIFDERYMTEPEEKYVQSGMLEEFAASIVENGVEYGRLGNNFGNWQVKVLVKQNNEVWQTLTTSFEYQYFNFITTQCDLVNENAKTCEFLGQPFQITKGEGCGMQPVDITVSYFGGTQNLDIAQGDKENLQIGLITVRNMGSPCAENVLHLRFDKAIPSLNSPIIISPTEKLIKVKIDGRDEQFALPKEKSQIVEAKIKSENGLGEISIYADKEVLSINSNNIIAETNSQITIENSQLYLEQAGKKTEIKVLPDKATKLAELDSTEKINLEGENYIVKGTDEEKVLGIFPTNLEKETIIDVTNGEIKEIKQPWYGSLAW